MNKLSAVRAVFALPLAVVFLCAPTATFAAAKNKNPASKIYVADLTGESQVDTGERVEALSKKSVYVAEGTSFETKSGASDSLVFSNGTAIYVGSETRFEVKKFLQEPFLPNRSDLDAEPSISQTVVKITRGSVGICTSKLVAGSSMTYQTPHATVNIRGRKVMIEVSDNETRVSLLEGDVTVLAASTGAPNQTLRPGQQAIIRKTATDENAVVTVQPIMDEQQAKLDENVSLACISRRTVFFEVAPRGEGEEAEIRPVQVVPASHDPGFTVSPARIGG
ncbi:MAG: FecR domain-containing protein [Nibricoccus sp.]